MFSGFELKCRKCSPSLCPVWRVCFGFQSYSTFFRLFFFHSCLINGNILQAKKNIQHNYHLNFVSIWFQYIAVAFSSAIICWHVYRVYVRLLQILSSKYTKLPIRIPVYYPIDLLLKKNTKSGFHFFFSLCTLLYVTWPIAVAMLLLLLLLINANSFSSIWSKNSKCQNRCWLMLTSLSLVCTKHRVTEIIILLCV